MSAQVEKIALFIDGANLYATAKSLGFDIDYKRLLREFQSRGNLMRAFYYTAVIEDQEYSSIRPLIDWLDYNGYTVVTKATKEFVDQTGRRKVKGNMDIELAVDCHGTRAAHRPHGAVLRRRRLPLAGRGGAAPRRARDGGLDDLDPAADGGRRTAPAGRHLHRHRASCSRRSAATRPNAPARDPRASRAASVSIRRSSCNAAAPRGCRPAPTTISRIDRAASCSAQFPAWLAQTTKPGRNCPLCPRLVAFRADLARARAVLVQRAGALVRAARRAAADRRPRAGPARRQPHRAAVHRRLRRRPALRHAQGIRFCPRRLSRRAPDDTLELVDARITNGVRCVPPENKPTPAEINTCREFLVPTIAEMPQPPRHRRARPHRA